MKKKKDAVKISLKFLSYYYNIMINSGIAEIRIVLQWLFNHLKCLLNIYQVASAVFNNEDASVNKRCSSFSMEFTVWQEKLKIMGWYRVSVRKGKEIEVQKRPFSGCVIPN